MPYFHVWFGTKRRKWLLQGDVLEAVNNLLPEIAASKGIKLIEFEAIIDHVHLLLDLPQEDALPNAMMNLKGVSAKRIFERFRNSNTTPGRRASGRQATARNLSGLVLSAQSIRRYIRTQWDRLEKYDR